MKRRIIWVLLSCVLAVLLLSSCQPKQIEEQAAQQITGKVEEGVVTKGEVSTPVVTKDETPQYGGTLTVLWFHCGLDPQTWDPADYNWIGDPFMSPYSENLLMGDLSKGRGGTNQFDFVDLEFIPSEVLMGNLAERWELEDPVTIIYTLRKGIMWPNKSGVMNSRELIADDVVFCFNRLLESPKGSTVHPFFATPNAATARGKYTVVLKMKSYQADWLTLGWGYYCKIYPPELVKAGIKDWKNAVGTGPFMLQDYVSGSQVTYVKNPDYWNKTVIKGKEYKLPFVDRLVWPIIPDESTRLAALRTGKCDISDSVSWKYKETLQKTNPQLIMYRWLSTTGSVIAMRTDKKPFDDIRVRRALSMAIDRAPIITSMMGGEGEVLSWPFSKGWGETWYTPLEKLPLSTRELFEYNPQKAIKLLAEAGYPTGFQSEIQLMAGSEDLMSLVKSDWEKIGVKVTLKSYSYGTYLGIMNGKQVETMYHMYKGEGDPISQLKLVGLPGQVWNPSEFNDPYYTETYAKASQTLDKATQDKLLKELNVYIIDKVPWVILPIGYGYAYAQPWTKNWFGEFVLNPRSPGQIHARIWLDLEAKAKR